MKNVLRGIILVLGIALIFGCVDGVKVKPIQPCIVDKPDGSKIELNLYCQEIETAGRISHICNLQKEYSVDACYLHRGMEVIAKEGLVLEGYTFEEFESWANWVKERVEAGLTYGLLKDIILAQFTKINKMLGAQILILGDMFLELPQDALIPEDDAIMVASSIDDLVEEVKRLDIWLN